MRHIHQARRKQVYRSSSCLFRADTPLFLAPGCTSITANHRLSPTAQARLLAQLCSTVSILSVVIQPLVDKIIISTRLIRALIALVVVFIGPSHLQMRLYYIINLSVTVACRGALLRRLERWQRV